MKRITLTFVLAFLASCTAIQAQQYVRYSANTGCDNQLIRTCPAYTSQTEVLYTKDSESGYMELWVEGVATCRIPVLMSYEVKDMKVYENLLYFCGRHKSWGFIAVLNLQDMFMHAMSGTTPTSAAISYMDMDPQYISSLEKLVVYGDGNNPMSLPLNNANEHIAAIGKGGTSTNADWVAVYLKYNNIPMTPSPVYTPYIVNVKVIDDCTSPVGEPLSEVLLTDDYVAFVRYRYGSDEYIVHRCDRNNLVGTYNTVYRYAVPHDEVVFNLDGVTLEGNNIALATCAPVDMYYNDYEIRVRNIELNSMTMFNSQYIPVGEVKQDVAVVYNRSQQKLVSSISYQLLDGGYGYGLIEIDPWHSFTGSNYYMTNAVQDQAYREFIPMDQALSAHFVALDKTGWLRKRLPMNSGYNGTCFNLPGFTVYELPDRMASDDGIILNLFNPDCAVEHQEAPISDITTNIECIVQE